MSTALLTLILPYLPNLLEFLAVRLDRTVPDLIALLDKHLNPREPIDTPLTGDHLILWTVQRMVDDIGKAHPEWSDEEKRSFAVSASRGHLEKSGIALTD